MAVRKRAEMMVSRGSQDVSVMIRGILARDHAYRQTQEEEDGMVFITNLKPHWLLMSTPMRVRLIPESSGTNIVIEILRNPWTSGDVFGFSERYINAFKAAVAEAGGARGSV